MILTEGELDSFTENMRLVITQSQKHEILKRFKTEPEPYEWSEQDISVQIQNFIAHGGI